jgi:alkaline phosphatase D
MYHQGIMELLGDDDHFPFGVASGDPRQEQVVLWTKVLPKDIGGKLEVEWVIASDTQLTEIVGSGTVRTDSSSAFTVHVSAKGLKAGMTYFYRFAYGAHHSPIGRTRTAPENPDLLRLAVATCANYPAGYFNGYGLIAKAENIDAVIHLGDYIYEYGARTGQLRDHIPPHEILTLNDYRSRYAQYRLDRDLKEAHRLHPFITIWDDHEFANNSFKDGAQNHQPDEGGWEVRKARARQVYFEWMPVENPERQSIVRSFNYGGLADLFLLDGRTERTKPMDDFNHPDLRDTSRTMLGHVQTDWLTEGLKASKARWKILGNNVMFSVIDLGKFAKERQRNMDAWDGYPANRGRILDTLDRHGIRDLIVLTGDIHTAWAIELTRDPMDRNGYHRKSGRGVIGVELVAPSISSKNLDEMSGKLVARLAASYIKARKRNPHLRYANLMDHGFIILELTPEKASAQWIYSRTLKKPTMKTRPGRAWHFNHGGNKLFRGE